MSTIDFDRIKCEWQSLTMENAILKQKNIELARRLVSRNVTNNQQRLARSYRIGYIGFLFPLLAYFGLYHVIGGSVTLCVIYSIFGWLLGTFDLWFMSYIKSANYASMPTVDALKHATKVVVYQNWATIISIIGCIIIMVPLFYALSQHDEESVLAGGIIGAVIGCTFGAIKCINNHRLARSMVAELKSIEE